MQQLRLNSLRNTEAVLKKGVAYKKRVFTFFHEQMNNLFDVKNA